MRILRTARPPQEPQDPQGDHATERRSPAPEIERRLLRLSVDELTAERSRCDDCGRTPLIGEDIHLYGGGRIVCELCRQLCRDAPVHTSRVRHSEFEQSVHVRRLASVAVLASASPAAAVLASALPPLRPHFLEGVPERPSHAA